MRLILLAVLLLAPLIARADARLTIEAADPLAELVVSGVNSGATALPVTVRIDDRPAAAYSERVNEERVLPPGPFVLRLRLAALLTPRGRPLDRAAPWHVIVFAPDGGVSFNPLRLELPPALPPQVRGWYFGPDWSVPLRGFETVQPGDPRVSGPHVEAVARPGGDPVLAHGMRLTRFAASLPPGRWRVTLWTEDPGAWETLPPVLEQRIRLNGVDVFALRRSYAEWVAQRYLAGRTREANPAQTPFAAIGALRGDRVWGDVTVGADGAFVVELAGFPQAATHIAAIVAAPAEAPEDGAGAVEALRASRFAETWPVLVAPPAHPAVPAPEISAPAPAVSARGGVAVLRLEARVPAAEFVSAWIAWDGAALPARILWGQWGWHRPGANGTGLQFAARQLRADVDAVPLRPDLPRPFVVLVQAAEVGKHHGWLVLRGPDGALRAPISVEVLAADRATLGAQVGAFLDFAPQLLGDPAWDRGTARRDARRQAACDLTTLGQLGLAALMPPVGRIDEDLDGVVEDVRVAAAHGKGPIIAYAPLRALPRADAPAWIVRAEAALAAAGLPRVVWSLADEPAYNGTLADAAALADAVHRAAPQALLAGHLNDVRDAAILPALALATVNPGYGVDAADIAALRAVHVRPFLYNMPEPRLAAGAYLWRSGADGLVQWHARMPTADAFDPTDGREGDVQFLWPTPGICAPADLDAGVLDLVEGAEDLRWFAWLDAAAARSHEAAALRRKLWADVPGMWAPAARLAGHAGQWRAEIVGLARKIQP